MAALPTDLLQYIGAFLKAPQYIPFRHLPLRTKAKVFWSLLGWGLLLGIAITMTGNLLLLALGLELGKHASETFMAEYNAWQLLALGVVIAPILEELLFRGPLVFFRDKPRIFPYAYYLSVLAFGFMHLMNFEARPLVWILAPLWVGPQLVLGVFLGYIRVRMGLQWSILLHASHNFVLMAPFALLKALDVYPNL